MGFNKYHSLPAFYFELLELNIWIISIDKNNKSLLCIIYFWYIVLINKYGSHHSRINNTHCPLHHMLISLSFYDLYGSIINLFDIVSFF